MDIYKSIEELKIIPVATINKISATIPLGKALIKAALPVIEVTFRTDVAAESLQLLTSELPELLVGAGTVLTIEQVKRAVNAGVQFIVTPGFNPKIVDFCVNNNITIIPGLNTPTMVEWALERGIRLVKFFPADISGGPKMLKALAGPYPSMKFIPTGGVNNQNIIEYLKLENVLAVAGSWIIKKDLITVGKFNEITRLTKDAVSLLKKNLSKRD